VAYQLPGRRVAAQKNLASQGRFFWKLRSVGITQHPQITFVDPSASIRSGRAIHRINRKTISRRGPSDTLE